MTRVQTVDAAPYRELIRRQHVSQDMVWVRTGVNQATVCEILAGKAKRISTRIALKLLRGLEGNIIVHQRGEEM